MKQYVLPSTLNNYENNAPKYKNGEYISNNKSNNYSRGHLLLKPIIKKENSQNNLSQKKSVKFHVNSDKKPFISNFNTIKISDFSSINALRPKKNYISNNVSLPKIHTKKDEFSKNNKNSSGINIGNKSSIKERIFSLNNEDKINNRYNMNPPYLYRKNGQIYGNNKRIRIREDFSKYRKNIYQDLKIKSLDVNKLWKNKVKKEREKIEINYVSKLEEWEKEYIIEDKNKNNNKNEENEKNNSKNNKNNKNNNKTVIKEKKKSKNKK